MEQVLRCRHDSDFGRTNARGGGMFTKNMEKMQRYNTGCEQPIHVVMSLKKNILT
jgi:hypothetical protein